MGTGACPAMQRARPIGGIPRLGRGLPRTALKPAQPRRHLCHALPRAAETPDRPVDTAELGTVLRLALPALAIVLSDPLQTLVDSAAVGRQSTIQLAALGPNTALFNAFFHILSFVGVATANVVATNSLTAPGLGPAEAGRRAAAAAAALSSALALALALGLSGAVALRVFGPSWLAAMGTPPEVLGPAAAYLGVRALAAPAALVINACQGACLGRQDTVTPMWVCIIATALAVVGNVALVWGMGLGVVGAAAATVGAQVAAAALILWRSWAAGRLPGGVPLNPVRYPPSRAALASFLGVGAALIARTAVGIAAYFAMAVAATQMGTATAAAHQIAMQLFWFVSFFPEPLSMAAQSLIARERGSPVAAAAWARSLLRYGFFSGLILAGAVAGGFYFGAGVFTRDAALVAAVRALAPLGAAAMAICGAMMALDGISIGAGTFAHLPVGVGAGLGVVLGVLWWGERAGAGLPAVWWALIGFYLTRLAAHGVYYTVWWRTSVFCGFGAAGNGEGGGGRGGGAVAAAA